jgi:hypothetical protein
MTAQCSAGINCTRLERGARLQKPLETVAFTSLRLRALCHHRAHCPELLHLARYITAKFTESDHKLQSKHEFVECTQRSAA